MSKRKILVVDDEDDIRYILRRFLEKENYHVAEARNGLQCFEMIERDRPDLVLLDILMPGMNGWEVCKHLKEDVSQAPIPVSFLSILTDSIDMARSLNYSGADSHLGKPIDFKLLSKTVRDLLDEYDKRPPKPP